MKFKKGVALILLVLMGVTNIPFDFLARSVGEYFENKNIVDTAWRASTDSNVVDNFIPLGKRLTLLRTPEAKAAVIAQYTGGLLVYADTVTVGTPKYKTFDDTTGFGAEQNASSVGASAINWIRVAAAPTRDEWIIVTRDAGNVIKAQVCTGVDGGVSCGAPTTITATAGTHGLRNYDIAYEQTSGDALLVYGTATADELRKIEWNGTSWVNDAAITTTRTTGTVEWVELTSRPGSNQIGIAYSDTNDDVSAYRWDGTTAANEATAVITATAVTGDVRKFDVSFEGTSGDMLVVAWVAGAGTAATGQLVGTTWTIGTQTGVDMITGFVDVQEPNPSDNDLAVFSHGTAASANPGEGFEWSGTAVVDGTAGDDVIQNWAANYQLGATAYLSTTYYAVTVHSSSATPDDIDWWTMNSAGTITDQAVNARTRGASRFIDLFDYPSLDKVLLLTSDANSDLWADTWNGSTPGATAWTDLTSGGALETALSIATKDVVDFAFRLAPPPAVTTISNFVSGEPGNSTIAPVASGMVDSFGLQTSAGSDTVTAATVSLAAGTGARIATVAITNDADTVTYCSAAPSGDSASLSGCGIPVSTTNTQFKIKITAISHASMPAPDGGLYAVTATVTGFTSTNSQFGTDSGSSTLTIDNDSPAGTTGAGATSGESTQSTVNWTNPGDGDFQQVYIYCKTSSMISGEAPTEGTDPAVDATACDATARMKYKGAASPQTITGLTNGQLYYFRIYARDTNGNFTAYSATQEVSATPSAPANVTTIADGTNPGNSTVAPSSTITDLDAFTLSTNSGTDSVTALTVTLTGANSFESLSEVRVTSSDGLTTYFSAVANPLSNTVNFSGGTPIPITTTGTTFKVRITPKTHANMPVPPGLSYGVGGTVTAFTSTNTQSGTDTGSATITVDNLSPNGATSVSGSAGDTAVTINWTTSNSGDFNTTSGSVIYRWASGTAGSEVPTEGSTPTTGSANGTAIVACVISSAASSAQSKVDGTGGSAGCTTTALTNGQAYTYKAFQKDTNGNYDAGVSIGTFTPARILTIGVTAAAKPVAVSSGLTSRMVNSTTCTGPSSCAAFTLSLNSGSETVTSIKITEIGTVDATNNLSNLALFYDTDGNWSDAGAETQYGSTVAAFTSEAATVSGSLAITAGTTYYFYVRIDLAKAGTYPSGGQGIDFQIAANGDVTVSGSSTKTGAPATLTSAASTCTTTSHTCVRPDATGTTYGSGLADGARSGESITISGYGFGTALAGSRANCTGAVNTGCVKFIVGGNATVADADINAWSNTSVTLTINNLASYGGVSGLEVNAGNINDTTALTFYIYPNINQIITPSVSNAAQEAENITLTNSTASSARFGATQGTVDFVGGFGTVSASIVSWGDTSVTVTVPSAISNSVYLGDIILTRASDTNSKTDLAYGSDGFRILPRITANSPVNGLIGDTIQLAGDHFCQTGTCPVSPNRSSATDNVKFGTTQAADGDFQNLTGGAGVCNGTGAAWNHSEICVNVPTGAPTGSQPTIIKSNSYDSNTQAFTVISATPSDPTSLNQFKDIGLTQSITVGDTASSTPIYLKQTMEVTGVSGGTLYPQFEYQLTGTTFVCGAGACGSAVEGTGSAGPGPATGSKSISPTDGTYHWQARTRHNKNSVDYYSNWVSFGGNGEPSGLDFKIDTTGPSITSVASSNVGSNSATITWDTLGETGTSQVQYNKTGTFGACSGDCTTLDTNLTNTHTVNLSNLDSGTLYYYRVRSKDVAGNESISSNSTFTTATVSDPSKTVRFHIVGSTGSITNASPLSQSFSVFMTENSTTTRNAFVVITGVYDASAASPTLTVQVNSETSKTYTLPPFVSKNYFNIIHRVSGVTVDPGTNTLTVTPDVNTTAYVSSADVYVTYSYTP